MLHGAPEQAQWHRAQPRRQLPPPVLRRIVEKALPGRRVLHAEPLHDGYRNANFKMTLDAGPAAVLRVYEHDASLCAKEMDLLSLVRGVAPVPDVLFAGLQGDDELPPYAVMQFVEGCTYRDLKRSGNPQAIAEAACSIGRTLAAIGSFRFERVGWIGPGPQVTSPLLEGSDPLPRFVDLCLASPKLQAR